MPMPIRPVPAAESVGGRPAGPGTARAPASATGSSPSASGGSIAPYAPAVSPAKWKRSPRQLVLARRKRIDARNSSGHSSTKATAAISAAQAETLPPHE